jgi:prepilin-type processing-associated H-X9-DG protein
VISIIAILAALLLPALTRAKTVARQSLCLSNMKQVGQGVFLYTDDFNEYFPSITYSSYTYRTWPNGWTQNSGVGWLSPLGFLSYGGYSMGATGLNTKSYITACPVFIESSYAKAWGNDLIYKHGGTYSFNCHFDQTLTLQMKNPNPPLKKFFTVPRLSSRAFFLEGASSQARTYSSIPTIGYGVWYGHGGKSSNFLYGDGHAESLNISSVPYVINWPDSLSPPQSYGADTKLKEPW